MNTLKTSTLRPGLIVSLKTSVIGNVSYQKSILEREHLTKEGKAIEKWETQRTVADPVENEAAHKARCKARALIAGVCSNSAFGLLCPESASEELDNAVAEARRIADEFNETAKLSRVYVYVIAGRIASDDVEAVKAINSELRDLLSDMEDGLKNLDVKTVRDAASKAKSIGQMLSPDAAARVQMAIDAARSSARKIVKAGEQAASEIDRRAIRAISEARTAFLDLDETKQVAAPKADARAIDLTPAKPVKRASAQTRMFEVE